MSLTCKQDTRRKYQNTTAFKEIHVFTQGNISEYVRFQKIYQQYPFLITISVLQGWQCMGKFLLWLFTFQSLNPTRENRPPGGNKHKHLFWVSPSTAVLLNLCDSAFGQHGRSCWTGAQRGTSEQYMQRARFRCCSPSPRPAHSWLLLFSTCLPGAGAP